MERVKIIKQDHYGRGVCKVNDKVTFVEKALPGDDVDIEIIENKKKFNVAKVIKYYESSIIESVCPYYDECGGCDLLHQKYSEQLLFKKEKVKDILNKFTDCDIKVNDVVFDKEFNYRNKIILHNLGLYKKKSNDVINIDKCLLVHDKINEIISRLKGLNLNIDEVMIRVSNFDEVMLDIHGNVDIDIIKDNFKDIDVVIINDNYLTDKKVIIDGIDGIDFVISNTSFYQVNRYLTSKLYNKVIDYIKEYKSLNALDLYCGTGTMTLMMSKYVENVIGIEVVESAIRNANYNKENNNINNVSFICGKVEDHIDNFKNIDLIIVDPPRSGLDNKTINSILEIKPNKLIYVSCNPVTLARDLNVLKDKYDIIEVTPFDMFPNTCHVECTCLLKLK